MATPHHGMQQKVISLPQSDVSPGPSQFILNLISSDMLEDITDQFVPLMGKFRIYYFWEQIETVAGDICTYIVDESSAAPIESDTERCGILATHSSMTKFSSTKDHGFSVVSSNLERYVKDAPLLIKSRWRSDREQLGLEWREQAKALFQESTRLLQRSDTEMSSLESINEYFIARGPVKFFTGRQWHAQYVSDSFGPIKSHDTRTVPKIFVIHGMGGSGKTQFCRKFAYDCRQR
jgi:predicted alpha/beta-fold hydrolase